MKKILLILFLLLGSLHSVEIIVPVHGDYALIDTSQSNAMVEIFRDEATTSVVKRNAAKEVAARPGSYNPVVLLEAGFYFLSEKDYEIGAPLCIGALFRSEIDARNSQDQTVSDVVDIIYGRIVDILSELTEDELPFCCEALDRAQANFIEWDKNTPRDYDDRWIRLHSLHAFGESTFEEISEAEKLQIIERFYREILGEFIDEDYANASMEDIYYFDREKRIYYFNGAKLSFYLPETMTPSLDRFGHYTSLLFRDNKAELWLDSEWSSEPESLDFHYEHTLSCAERYCKKDHFESKHQIEKCFIGNGIPAFTDRYTYQYEGDLEKTVDYEIHFVDGRHSFTFSLRCREEEEARLLDEMECILRSVTFSL